MLEVDERSHANSAVRQQLLVAAEAALAAVQPEGAIARAVRRSGGAIEVGGQRLVLAEHERAVVIGFGKAAVPMGRAALRLLEGLEVGGVLASSAPEPVDGLEVVAGGHPVPDCHSLDAGRRVLEVAATVRGGDLVVVLISGGGSAVIEAPAAGLTLEDLQATTSLLLRSGATIVELNAVRKHLSAIKGGRLGQALAAARTLLTLVIPDVVGSPLDVVASGPAVPDPSTYADALAVLDRRGLRDAVPAAVRQRLEAGADGLVPETPSIESDLGPRARLLAVVGDGGIAAEAARAAAERDAGPARVVTTRLEGEARVVALDLIRQAEELEPGHALVHAGETTVTVSGQGRGGRNQELALAAAIALDGRDDLTLLSLGTDGIDGMSPSAGAFADGGVLARGRALGLDAVDHLDRNDSHAFLAATGDTVDGGPTGTNVGDLVLVRRH